jgi:ubiquinone/menaquinone biosynthesis C-methylase UbiE
LTTDPAYLRDPTHVREQYASETNLVARASLYQETAGRFAGDVAFDAVAEVDPRRFLEVGCGTGWFAARVERELGAEVVAVDQSARMVELAGEAGIDARVGDVQELPFADGEFDCVAANWMLYHVSDLDRGLAEIARVLRGGGRLVAVTVGIDHLLELWDLVGAGEIRLARDLGFSAENGAEKLRRHFKHVETRDASGTVTIREREPIVRYVASSEVWRHLSRRVPERLDEPLVARTSVVVFVAET